MNIEITKRDGRKKPFNREKIELAVQKAIISVDGNLTEESIALANRISESVESEVQKSSKTLSVENIQDIVERKLMASSRKDVAKAYITYRTERTKNRERNSKFRSLIREKVYATNVQNQNANVDEHSFGGRKGEADSVLMKEIALYEIMSDMARENHLNNEIYEHDLDSYALGCHNCLTVPFSKVLAQGFNVRNVDIRPAGSVSTAMQLVAVLFQIQSLQQFGGVSAGTLDHAMVPYVRKSFTKHLEEGLVFVEGLSEYKGKRFRKWLKNDEEHPDGTIHFDDEHFKKYHEKAWEYAMYMTEQETRQAAEGLFHNLNSLQSRSGNQLPFSSINYGTCTLPEGRMVTKAILEASIDGVGKHHKTSIFPCGIFQYMKGVNDKPGTPNYDLKRLALKSTSKRLYPNYGNVDWSGNAGYDINDPRTYFSTMGALASHEHLYIKIDNGNPIDISIKDFFYMCKGDKSIKGRPMQLHYNKPILNIPTDTNWRNTQNKKDSIGILSEPGVYKVTYIPEDVSYIGSSRNIKGRFLEHKKCIRHRGGLDAGLYFGDTDTKNYKFEVVEYTEDYKTVEDKYIMSIPNANFRGITSKFYKNVGLGKNKGYDVRPVFYMDPSVPQDLIDLSDSNVMVLDRGNKWVKVKHVFKNSEMNTPYMMHISYIDDGKTYTLCCTEDHPLWNGTKFVEARNLTLNDKIYRGDGKELSISLIKWHNDRQESYDIGTETGSFIGSDIIMHNCRTANGWDINGLGQLKDGRGNICPVTIIMPTIAMETKGEVGNKDINDFIDRLDKKITEAKDMLIERFEYICSQPMESARFMYENGMMEGYVPEEGIRSALKHGTLAVGQLGLAETLQILIGKDHTTEEGMSYAKIIEGLFKKRCAEFKEKYKLNFGVYYTPAENLCYTSMKKFKEKYGEIENISDRDYFTNSIHVPVWKDMSPFDKIDIESQLTGYSNAGCITYVELDGSVINNIDAIEEIVDYAMEKDIPYFAINVPSDTCLDCGYQGEFNDKCPECGSTNIQQLRRVTGYLTGNFTTSFNRGKINETNDRVRHVNKFTTLEGVGISDGNSEEVNN